MKFSSGINFEPEVLPGDTLSVSTFIFSLSVFEILPNSNIKFYFKCSLNTAAFRRFKDFDKYIILIYLINKAFKGYNDHFVVNSFDEFYSKENFEIPKINIIDLSRELNISKETTRIKMM